MKRIGIFIILSVLVFGLIGCGSKEEPQSEPVTESKAEPEDVVEKLQEQYSEIAIELKKTDEFYVDAKSYQIDLNAAEDIGKICKDNNLKYVVQMGTVMDFMVLYSDGEWNLASITDVPKVSSKRECEEAINELEKNMPTEEALKVYTGVLYSYVAGFGEDSLDEDLAFCAVKYYEELLEYEGFEEERNLENQDGSVEKGVQVFYAPPYDYEETSDELKLYYEQGILVISKKDYSAYVIKQEEENKEEVSTEEGTFDPLDIHSYVDCGEIVQYSKLDGDGDFGDVDVTEVLSERYVTIYSDGTYYYMFDYMNNMLTIAYIEKE